MAKKILIADDDNLIRAGLANALKTAGYEVIEAADGKETLASAKDNHPDLIIADIHMPQMDGFEMLDELRKDEWGKTARVVIMSSDEETTTLNQALEAGVTVYLAKSTLTPDELTRQVQASLG